MPLSSERKAVQEALIRYAGEVGWEYVPHFHTPPEIFSTSKPTILRSSLLNSTPIR